MSRSALNLSKFESVLKQKFFFEQSFSIYGGMSGLFDLGPFGCQLQNNIVNEWRKHFILKDHMQEIDCSILTSEQVLKASGHLSRFSDLMVRDMLTNESFRVDHLLEAEFKKRSINGQTDQINMNSTKDIDNIILKHKIRSPTTGNQLSPATEFNLMFQTNFGPSGLTKWYLFCNFCYKFKFFNSLIVI
jgi:glycyl-tRNA synthetase